MPARYGSDLIVDLMKVLGIEAVALNPGSSFRGIHDSLVNYESGTKPNPEMILCCHEEIAVAVAHGYFKATGKIMPAIVHNVVGLQHASMAIYNAWCDRTPVMVMGGTGPMNSSKRRPWIDWIHTAQVQGNLVRDFVKWDDQPFGVEAIPSSMMRGYRIAMSDPHGPVYLCFDVSDQEAPIDKEIPLPDPRRFRPPAPLQAEAEAIKEAARLLASAQNPVIVADYVGRNHDAVSKPGAACRSLVDPRDRSRRPAQFSQHPRAQSHRQESGSHRQCGCHHGTRCHRSVRRAGETRSGDACGGAGDQARL